VGFEPTIPVFQRAKTVHGLDLAATVNDIRKSRWIKFYKAMVVLIFTYGSEIRIITKGKQEAKIETAEMRYLRSPACYRRKDLVRNTKIKEVPNILNRNTSNAILKVQMEVETSRSAKGRQANCEENRKIEPKKTKKHRAPTVKLEGPTYFPRRSRQSMA
jgi:hypothetical protein